jgi:hypothetical protein
MSDYEICEVVKNFIENKSAKEYTDISNEILSWSDQVSTNRLQSVSISPCWIEKRIENGSLELG